MSDRSMDSRCPRKLDELPCEACPLAVLRLKALRNAGKELSEDEEERLPGCPYAILHQMSNYCFFNYSKDYMSESPSDKEIAHMNSVSVDTVKSITAEVLVKLKNKNVIKELKNEPRQRR
jgi:hypothetical protein